jgi:hypothetical protein
MSDFPKIISVDDHVVEPANVWINRLPAKYHGVGPRVVRARSARSSLSAGSSLRRSANPGRGPMSIGGFTKTSAVPCCGWTRRGSSP